MLVVAAGLTFGTLAPGGDWRGEVASWTAAVVSLGVAAWVLKLIRKLLVDLAAGRIRQRESAWQLWLDPSRSGQFAERSRMVAPATWPETECGWNRALPIMAAVLATWSLASIGTAQIAELDDVTPLLGLTALVTLIGFSCEIALYGVGKVSLALVSMPTRGRPRLRHLVLRWLLAGTACGGIIWLLFGLGWPMEVYLPLAVEAAMSIVLFVGPTRRRWRLTAMTFGSTQPQKQQVDAKLPPLARGEKVPYRVG